MIYCYTTTTTTTTAAAATTTTTTITITTTTTAAATATTGSFIHSVSNTHITRSYFRCSSKCHVCCHRLELIRSVFIDCNCCTVLLCT